MPLHSLVIGTDSGIFWCRSRHLPLTASSSPSWFMYVKNTTSRQYPRGWLLALYILKRKESHTLNNLHCSSLCPSPDMSESLQPYLSYSSIGLHQVMMVFKSWLKVAEENWSVLPWDLAVCAWVCLLKAVGFTESYSDPTSGGYLMVINSIHFIAPAFALCKLAHCQL